MHPNSKWAFPAHVMAWCWSTCSWAMMVKAAQEALGTSNLYPTTSFWVAFFPQMMLAIIFLTIYGVLAGCQGMSALRIQESSVRNGAWYWGGAAQMFGGLFSVMALGAAAPALVFVGRASQTLLGSLLGVPGLGKRLDWYLLGAVAASFAAIAVTSFAATPEASWKLADPFIAVRTDQVVGRAGLVFALVCTICASLGGAAQACAVKSGYNTHEYCGPMEALRNICVAGTLLGGVVLLIWCSAHSALNSYLPPHQPVADGVGTLKSTFAEFGKHSGFWFLLTLYQFFQQSFSVLLLNVAEVCDHQQVAGCMYTVAAIYVMYLIQLPLTSLIVVGVALSGLGLFCFFSSLSSETGVEKLRGASGIPVTMQIAAVLLTILGCASPFAFKLGLAYSSSSLPNIPS